MNQIETRITELVNWVRANGAYSCRLTNVRDMAEKPTTVLVMMLCQNRDTHSFEVHYGGAEGEPQEEDDAVLKRRIALGIINIFARNK